MVKAQGSSQDTIDGRSWSWLALIAALVLLTRPYRGIFHDGHLYAAQALRWLDPSALRDDIFFAFGNQDSFSLFTLAYAPVIDALGIFPATLAVYALGLIVWTFAVFKLADALLGGRQDALICTAFAVCLYPAYGSLVLSYGEEFVSPRIFAETFGFAAITLALRSRRWLGLLAIGVAVLVHPLVGLSFFALWLWLTTPRKVWFFAIGVMLFAMGLALGAIGIVPFTWIFEGVAGGWMALIERHAPLVLVGQWPVDLIFGWIPLPLVSLLLIWRHGLPVQRDLAAGVLIIGVGFTALSFVLADLWASRFFVGLQLWRATMLLAFFGNLVAFAALRSLSAHPRARVLLRLAMGFSIICFVMDLSPLPVGLMATAASLAYIAEDARPGRTGVIWHLVYGIPLLASLLIGPSLVVLEVQKIGGTAAFLMMARLLLIGGTLALLVVSFSPSRKSMKGAAAFICLLGAVGLADLRTERQIFWARGGTLPDEFAAHLEGQTTYWENELVSLWIGLRMQQYYSCRQSAGMVFFEDQAHEIVRRARVLRELNTSDFFSETNTPCTTKADPSQNGPPNVTALASVCRALPDLDTVILKEELPEHWRASWIAPFGGLGDAETIPVFMRSEAQLKRTPYFAYSCDDFR